MTREEAITSIERLAHTEAKWPGTEDTLEALDMALTALRPVSREQVEKMRGEWIHDGPKFNGGTDWYHCSKCGAKETGVYVKHNFCSYCGAPTTDEAVEMVMERMEALYENRD